MGMHIDFVHGWATVDSVDSGSRIRALRKSRGLTQGKLAKLIGLDQSTVSDIERGANFGADVLHQLCEQLQTTSRYIMRGGNDHSDLYEAELVGLFRALPEADQAHLLRTLRALAAQSLADPSPPAKPPFRITR